MTTEIKQLPNTTIAVLFKPCVRRIDNNYMGGCERIFLKDVYFLNRIKLLTNAYCSAQLINIDKSKLTIIKKGSSED